MIYLKRYLAGVALPSVLFPLIMLSIYLSNRGELLGLPFLYFIPMIWGIWNILDYAIFDEISVKDKTVHSLVVGAILGFVIACVGVFCLDLPMFLGLPRSLMYLPLLIGPLVYAILWAFVVQPLNDLLK